MNDLIQDEEGMPKANTIRPSRSIRRIALDGHFLDEIRTRLHTDATSKSISSISAPVEQHQVTEDETGVTLKIPALTALQLYRDRILPAEPRMPILATWSLTRMFTPRSVTISAACRLASCRWARISRACCRGASLTTGRSCGV